MDRPIDPKMRRTHRLLYAGIAVAIVAGIVVMLAQQSQRLGGSIVASELQKHIGKDPYHHVVIDLREPEAFSSGHIPFSVNYPASQIPRRMGELEDAKDRQIVLVGIGPETANTAVLLQRAGFLSVLELQGGFDAWRDEGRQLTTDDDSPIHKIVN